MARVGKITIYVDQTMNSQRISVRTTGQVGAIPLNTVSKDLSYNFKTSEPTAQQFWEDILSLASTGITS